MGEIQKIFIEYGPEYLDRFGDAMPLNHKALIDAIIQCRTQACGITVYECEECGEVHHFYRSRGNLFVVSAPESP